jgi:hypothetical protein
MGRERKAMRMDVMNGMEVDKKRKGIKMEHFHFIHSKDYPLNAHLAMPDYCGMLRLDFVFRYRMILGI